MFPCCFGSEFSEFMCVASVLLFFLLFFILFFSFSSFCSVQFNFQLSNSVCLAFVPFCSVQFDNSWIFYMSLCFGTSFGEFLFIEP